MLTKINRVLLFLALVLVILVATKILVEPSTTKAAGAQYLCEKNPVTDHFNNPTNASTKQVSDNLNQMAKDGWQLVAATDRFFYWKK